VILGYATYRERGTSRVGPIVHETREAAAREAIRRNEYLQGRRLGLWKVVALAAVVDDMEADRYRVSRDCGGWVVERRVSDGGWGWTWRMTLHRVFEGHQAAQDWINRRTRRRRGRT
jgi:hypothetical protein